MSTLLSILCGICFASSIYGSIDASLTGGQYVVRPGSWQELYPKLFNVRQRNADVTPEQARKLMQGLKDELADEKFPAGQKKEVRFWLDAAELDERKCKRSYDEHLLRRYRSVQYPPFLERWNLKVFLDDVRLEQLKYCLRTDQGVNLVYAVENIPAGVMDEVESIRSQPEAGQQLSFVVDRLNDQCTHILEPVSEFSEFTEYILHEDFVVHLDHSELLSRWAKLVKDCKNHMEGDKERDPKREVWYHLYGWLFAVDKYTAELSSLETREIMRKLSDIIDSGQSVPEQERHEVEFWLEASKLDNSKCRKSFDDDLKERVESVKMSEKQQRWNLKAYATDVRFLQLTSCLQSQVSNELTKSIESIPENVRSLVHEITKRNGEPSLENVINTLAPFYEPSTKIFGLKGKMDEESFGQVYAEHIVQACEAFLKPAQVDEAFVEYISQDEYRMLLDRDLRDWVDFVPACKKMATNEKKFRDTVLNGLSKSVGR